MSLPALTFWSDHHREVAGAVLTGTPVANPICLHRSTDHSMFMCGRSKISERR
jgi:hypothetical protein